MKRLVYISSSVEKMDQSEIEKLLDKSRKNNKEDNITGILLFHDGNFFQVLEGPEDKVGTCFGRIEKDQRHRGCIVLLSEAVTERLFADWSMAYVPFDRMSAEKQEGFLDLLEFRRTGKIDAMMRDDKIEVFLNAFLLNFRDL